MPKTASPETELVQIKRERERLQAQTAALAQREKAALEAIERKANDLLSGAFSKGRFGTVSKDQAMQLARSVATLGIGESLKRLAS